MVSHDLDWMDPRFARNRSRSPASPWVYCHTVVEVGWNSGQICYCMRSLKCARAAELLAYISDHWGIENRYHCVLDASHCGDRK